MIAVNIMRTHGIRPHDAARILVAFDMESAGLRTDIFLPGSPQRCFARVAAADVYGRVWMIERIASGQAAHREAVASQLHALAATGLSEIPAYLPLPEGSFVLKEEGGCWQISPFVQGDTLPQPDYIEQEDRGRSLARFLARLSRSGEALRGVGPTSLFSLPDYIHGLVRTIGQNRSAILKEIAPAIDALAPYLEVWDDLPLSIAHGDYHPLNIIWRGHGVRAVIDWEFTGPRPHLYDAANLLGCVGFEHPRALGSGLAPAFIETLREERLLNTPSAPWLPHHVLALRFAWLSEWLRLRDEDLLDMELAYMRILTNNLVALERLWRVRDI